jgi:hypothetical protein
MRPDNAGASWLVEHSRDIPCVPCLMPLEPAGAGLGTCRRDCGDVEAWTRVSVSRLHPGLLPAVPRVDSDEAGRQRRGR